MQDTYGKKIHQVPSKSVVMAPSYGQKNDFLPQEGGGGSDRVATPLLVVVVVVVVVVVGFLAITRRHYHRFGRDLVEKNPLGIPHLPVGFLEVNYRQIPAKNSKH